MEPAEISRWTPVALSADVPPATVIPAVSDAGSIALWRSRSGKLTAAADRCPHRGMRLSHGFVRGEALSCIYHGWSYGGDGRCLRIPAHPGLTPPEAVRVATFSVSEASGVIWVRATPATGAPDDVSPPVLAGLSGLRSLAMVATPASLARAAGGTIDDSGLIRTRLGVVSGGLLVADQGSQILVHVLVDETADHAEKIAASRAAETIRRAAEALSTESEAA